MKDQGKNNIIASFHISFSKCDAEAAEWFMKQPNKGAYLKSLILADKENGSELQNRPALSQDDLIWEQHFLQLKSFYYVHKRFPAYSECYEDFKLGRWLQDTVRRSRIKRPDRLMKIEALGTLDKWEQYYTVLKQFQSNFQRLPNKNEVFDDVKIGNWLHLQLLKLKKDPKSFSKEKLLKLSELGVYASDWDRKYVLLQMFVKEFNRFPRYTEIYHDVNLGRWLSHQQKTLDPLKHVERIEKIEKLHVLKQSTSNSVNECGKGA